MADYLFDTNVIIGLERFNRGEKKVSPAFATEIGKIQNKPNVIIYVSMISVAELAVFIRWNNWGQRRIKNLIGLLSTMILVDFGYQLIPNYVDIDLFSRGLEVNIAPDIPIKFGGSIIMKKNDLWIAATAKFHHLTLVTCDNDFGHLTNTPLCDVMVISST